MTHFPAIGRIRQHITRPSYDNLISSLPAEICLFYPQIKEDLLQAIQLIQNEDMGTIKRVGRCQIEKLSQNKSKIMIFDIHEKDRDEKIRGASKWIKTDNFMLTIDLENRCISKIKQYVSVSKQSPLFGNQDAVSNLIQDEFKEYKKIGKDGSIHSIYIQPNKGKTLIQYLHCNKVSAKKKNILVKKVLKKAFILFDTFHWNVSDIKLENILISEKTGKIKINFIDYKSEKALTPDKIPFDFLTYYPLLKEKEMALKALECLSLTFIACIEILSNSKNISIHEMKTIDIEIAINHLNQTLKEKILPTLTPEFRTFVFEDVVDSKNSFLNRSIYEISCKMLTKGKFLFSNTF
jgi:hypothetical protein